MSKKDFVLNPTFNTDAHVKDPVWLAIGDALLNIYKYLGRKYHKDE